jgi:hypothetical protein
MSINIGLARHTHKAICNELNVLREKIDTRLSALKSVESDLRKTVDVEKKPNGDVYYFSFGTVFKTKPGKYGKKLYRLKFNTNGILIADALLDNELRNGPNDIRLSIALGEYD